MKISKSKLIITLLLALVMIFATACIHSTTPSDICEGCDYTNCPDCDNTEQPVKFGIYFMPNWPGRPPQDFLPMYKEVGAPIALPVFEHQREGYRFDGWFEGQHQFNLTNMPSRHVNLTARWIRSLHVSFNTGDRGSTHSRIYVEEGDYISTADLPVPTRPNHRFDGWGIGAAPFTSGMLTDNLTLTAHWTAGYHSIVLNVGAYGSYEPMLNNRSNFDRVEIHAGQNATIMTHSTAGGRIDRPQIPTRPGYTFLRWERAGVSFDFTYMPVGGADLHAAWFRQSTLPAVHVDTFTTNPGIRNPNGAAFRRNQVNYPAAGYVDGVITAGVNTVGRGVTVPISNVQNPNFNFSDSSWVRSQFRIEDPNGVHCMPVTEVELRGRGSGSWLNYKRGYRFRFRHSATNTVNPQSPFGMPANENFVIVSGANFGDRTMLGNHTAYSLARNVLTNLPYAARTHMVEVYFNGVYHGVYMFAEHARPVPGRAPVYGENAPTLDRQRALGQPFVADRYSSFYLEYCARSSIMGTGNSGWGGLSNWHDGNRVGDANTWFRADARIVPINQRLIQSDRAEGGRPVFGMPHHPFEIIRPDPDNVRPDRIQQSVWDQQRNYIRMHMSNFSYELFRNEPSLYYIEQLACIDSIIDMYILHELFKNLDAGWSSFFIYRTPGPDGRIYFSPPWDFDATFNGGSDGIFVANPSDRGNMHFNAMFYVLTRRPEFMNRLRYRWQNINQDVRDFLTAHYNNYLNNHYWAFGRDHYMNQIIRYGGPAGSFNADGTRSPRSGARVNIAAGVTHWEGLTRGSRGLNWLTGRITWFNTHTNSPWRASLIPSGWTPPNHTIG